MAAKKDSLEKIQQGVKETTKQLQDTVTETTREVWYAGLGLLSTVEEEGSKLFSRFAELGKQLVEKGKEFEKKEGEVNFKAKVDEAVKFLEHKVQAASEKFGRRRQDELKMLNEKVDRLAETVVQLVERLDRNGGTAKK